MAARTCLYADPKKPGDGPRLYLSNSQGWVEDPQKAVEYLSLSTAARNHQTPLGYGPSQTILAEAIKVHPAILGAQRLLANLQDMFPQATVTKETPKMAQLSWFIMVAMPPEKRSFVVEYRERGGYRLSARKDSYVPESFLKEDDLLLRAITFVEPLTCHCGCHGPIAGFYHCFGEVCCAEPDEPRSNADRAARQAVSESAT